MTEHRRRAASRGARAAHTASRYICAQRSNSAIRAYAPAPPLPPPPLPPPIRLCIPPSPPPAAAALEDAISRRGGRPASCCSPPSERNAQPRLPVRSWCSCYRCCDAVPGRRGLVWRRRRRGAAMAQRHFSGLPWHPPNGRLRSGAHLSRTFDRLHGMNPHDCTASWA